MKLYSYLPAGTSFRLILARDEAEHRAPALGEVGDTESKVRVAKFYGAKQYILRFYITLLLDKQQTHTHTHTHS